MYKLIRMRRIFIVLAVLSFLVFAWFILHTQIFWGEFPWLNATNASGGSWSGWEILDQQNYLFSLFGLCLGITFTSLASIVHVLIKDYKML